MAKDTTAESLLRMGSVSDAVLSDWTEELAGVDQGQRKRRAEKHISSPVEVSTEPISGTKDPTKSLKRDTQLQKKGEKASSDGSEVTKTAVATKTVAKSSRSAKEKTAPKAEERRSDSQQSATPGQSSTTDVAAVLKEAFSDFAVQMNEGFSSLGELLKAKNEAKCDDNASALSDSLSDGNGASDVEPEEPARKKQKPDDGIDLSKCDKRIC